MNTLFPRSMSAYMNWCQTAARNLNEQTNGQVRIKPNRLAAILAKSLPDTPDNFNINTLKRRLDEHSQPKSVSTPSSTPVTVQGSLFQHMAREHVEQLSSYQDVLLKHLRTPDHLSLSAHLDTLTDEAHLDADALADDFAFVQQRLNDTERLNDAMSEWREDNPAWNGKFAYLEYTVYGIAYRRWLLERLELLLDAVDAIAEEDARIDDLTDPERLRWIRQAMTNWGEHSSDDLMDARKAVQDALRQTLYPPRYAVTLRAIVTGDYQACVEDFQPDPAWTIYDSDDKDFMARVCLETQVEVIAETREQAIIAAKEQAPLLNAADELNITLWLDDGPDDVLRVE